MDNVIKINVQLKYRISHVLFLIYILLKPFYIFGSGSIQPGDCFLLAAFFFVLVEESKRFKIIDTEIFVFVIFVAVINTSYYLFYQASDFLRSILYYVFNLLAILCFRNMMYDKNFMKHLVTVCKLNLLIQLLCFFTHIGQYWEDTYRYMGTYRDPNQLGFAIVSTFAIIFLMDNKRKYFYFFVSAFLVFQTASAGMLIALVLIFSFDLINGFRNAFIENISFKKIVFISILTLAIILVCFIGNISIDLRGFRIEDKITKSNTSIIQTFIDDRRLNVAFEHPVYFIFGYGEGFKFERYGYSSEMHSTWVSLCFYYGIIPFIILVKWIIKNIRGVPVKYAPVYIAIFSEAFTLINHRQPIFWMIIMMGSILRKDEKNNNEFPSD